MYTGVNMGRKGIFILATLATLSGLLATVHTQAQNNTGELNLTSSPLPIALKAKPGESISTELRIRNNSPQSEKLKIGLMKFSAAGDDGKPQLAEKEDGDDYFGWVKFSQTELTAESNEWKTVKMTITLPETAAFGYYYAVTFTRANQENADGSLQSAVHGGSATLVLLEADVSNAKRELSLESFTVGKRTYEFLPAKFSVKLHNNGNVHSAPTGNIFIKKGDDQVGTINVNSTLGNILPNSNRIYAAEWSEGFPTYKLKEENGKAIVKDGEQVYQLEWDASNLRNLRFGKYTATLVMVYNDGTRDVPLEATLTFWVIPWRLIFGGLLVTIFAGIGIWVTARKGFLKVHKKPKHYKEEK